MIIIVYYGLGNVHSIYAKICQIDTNVKISFDISDIETADKIILPGVGSFDAGMKKIHELELEKILQKKIIREKIPILGICLGMQIFTRHSEEGVSDGLGYLNAATKKFCFADMSSYNIPHMGWNKISIKRSSPILDDIEEGSRYYFAHSYHVVCDNPENVVALTHYGYNFPSIIQQDNIIGVQFHPEKSHKQGIQLLKNFIRL